MYSILFYSICYILRDEENNKNICIVIRLAKYSHFNNLQHAKVSLKKSVYGSINNWNLQKPNVNKKHFVKT